MNPTKHKTLRAFVIVWISLIGTAPAIAQEWWFWPRYTLGQKAENYPGNRIGEPESLHTAVEQDAAALLFHGEEPTDRRRNFARVSDLPAGPFSVEMWLVNHVNQPVGVLATVKSRNGDTEPDWLLGVYGQDVIFSLTTEGSPYAHLITHALEKRGWKNYWNHLVAVFDGTQMQLFVNGQRVSAMPAGKRKTPGDEDREIEVAAYTRKEPYMQAGNLLRMLRISNEALTQRQVGERFESLKAMVEEGKLFPGLFHFNAGPYLNYATKDRISIVWETDRAADFVVAYGERLPLEKRVEVKHARLQLEAGAKDDGTIYEVTLEGLRPGTPYFYNIKAQAHDGTVMESGVLTFSTAVNDSGAYAFAVIGDTEARPHINDRISKLIWDERPNFVLNVGDLTDGGKEGHKYQWNYEYFQGITQLASRIPVFPVPGNGEADLHWYKRYHALPDPEGYYQFTYGNADFFMLDSNRPEEFGPAGKQYAWLESKLRSSQATWKFVALHHAPYSADDDDYGDAWKGDSQWGDEKIRAMVPLFEKYGVDMVFFGHLHTYQRTLPIRDNLVDRRRGVVYVQGGGGGGNLEDFAPSRAWFSAKTYRGHHYFLITISDTVLNFKMYDTEGRLKDYLDISK